MALSHAIRDLVVDPWFDTTRRIYTEDRKRVYYLSMEFLIGRLLEDAVLNLGLEEQARAAMYRFGINYDEVVDDEPDAALGNGGLGRLAACFLDSMSTVGVAAYGYGIRYEHGLFKQGFEDGWQTERPEDWLTQSHPWEFERTESHYPIGFGGDVKVGADGRSSGPCRPAAALHAVFRARQGRRPGRARSEGQPDPAGRDPGGRDARSLPDGQPGRHHPRQGPARPVEPSPE